MDIIKRDERPRRGKWAPGDRHRRCQECDEPFLGHKFALVCANCAYRPIFQPTFSEIAAHVSADAYKGSTALVIGGSRGLGEVVAKAIAAGGGQVILTYMANEERARRLCNEIANAGGECMARRFDVFGDINEQLMHLPPVSHLYYFVTEAITARPKGESGGQLLDRYLKIYLIGFLETCEVIARARASDLRISYPSTIFISDTPPGFEEYGFAKACGEALCEKLNNRAGMTVISARLPKMLTDQTVSPLGETFAPVMDVMLPLVRKMHQSG